MLEFMHPALLMLLGALLIGPARGMLRSALVLLVLGYGHLRTAAIARESSEAPSLRVGVVQANVGIVSASLVVRGQAGGGQGADKLAGRNQDLAAHMTTLFLRGQLVFKMDSGGAGLNHRLHQLKSVERPPKTGFGIGHNGGKPVRSALASIQNLDLIRALQGFVDAPDHSGNTVGRIQALIRVHLAGLVGVRRHLPTRQVDGLDTGLGLLHGLPAGQRDRRGAVVDGRLHQIGLGQRVAAEPATLKFDFEAVLLAFEGDRREFEVLEISPAIA